MWSLGLLNAVPVLMRFHHLTVYGRASNYSYISLQAPFGMLTANPALLEFKIPLLKFLSRGSLGAPGGLLADTVLHLKPDFCKLLPHFKIGH